MPLWGGMWPREPGRRGSLGTFARRSNGTSPAKQPRCLAPVPHLGGPHLHYGKRCPAWTINYALELALHPGFWSPLVPCDVSCQTFQNSPVRTDFPKYCEWLGAGQPGLSVSNLVGLVGSVHRHGMREGRKGRKQLPHLAAACTSPYSGAGYICLPY